MEDQLAGAAYMAVVGLVVLIPIAGLIWLGARRERQKMQRLIREHIHRLERLSLIRGGRK